MADLAVAGRSHAMPRLGAKLLLVRTSPGAADGAAGEVEGGVRIEHGRDRRCCSVSTGQQLQGVALVDGGCSSPSARPTLRVRRRRTFQVSCT